MKKCIHCGDTDCGTVRAECCDTDRPACRTHLWSDMTVCDLQTGCDA